MRTDGMLLPLIEVHAAPAPVTTSEHYMHLDQHELADAMRRAQDRWET